MCNGTATKEEAVATILYDLLGMAHPSAANLSSDVHNLDTISLVAIKMKPG